MLLDYILPHLHPDAAEPEGPSSPWKRTTLLVLAVTLHNIPEGMAVGLSFALVAQHSDPAMHTAAMALAIGIGIQNFFQKAPPSPCRYGRRALAVAGRFYTVACPASSSLFFGVLAVVIAGGSAFNALAAVLRRQLMYVVVEELIPEAHLGELQYRYAWCNGRILVMMILWMWHWDRHCEKGK